MNYTLETRDDLENINHTISYLGQTKRDRWDCDAWIVTIYPKDTPKANGQSFEYFTGLGHRKNDKPKAPKMADVLYSLTSDSYACQISFEEWCSTYDYDTDSRKALETYLLCQENFTKLSKVLSRDTLRRVSGLLEDYQQQIACQMPIVAP